MRIDHCAGCGEHRAIQARDLCEKCYARHRRGRPGPTCGTVEGWRLHRRKQTVVCAPCQAARDAYLADRGACVAKRRAARGALSDAELERLRQRLASESAARTARIKHRQPASRTQPEPGVGHRRAVGPENPLGRTA